MSDIDINDRPRPIKLAAKDLAVWIGGMVALLSTTAGLVPEWFTQERVDALTALLNAVPGIIGLVGVVLTAFGIVRRSEPVVTPLVDPKDGDGWPLVVDPAAPPKPRTVPGRSNIYDEGDVPKPRPPKGDGGLGYGGYPVRDNPQA